MEELKKLKEDIIKTQKRLKEEVDKEQEKTIQYNRQFEELVNKELIPIMKKYELSLLSYQYRDPQSYDQKGSWNRKVELSNI